MLLLCSYLVYDDILRWKDEKEAAVTALWHPISLLLLLAALLPLLS